MNKPYFYGNCENNCVRPPQVSFSYCRNASFSRSIIWRLNFLQPPYFASLLDKPFHKCFSFFSDNSTSGEQERSAITPRFLFSYVRSTISKEKIEDLWTGYYLIFLSLVLMHMCAHRWSLNCFLDTAAFPPQFPFQFINNLDKLIAFDFGWKMFIIMIVVDYPKFFIVRVPFLNKLITRLFNARSLLNI